MAAGACAVLAVLLIGLGLASASPAIAAAKCKPGQAQLKVAKHLSCLSESLPAPLEADPRHLGASAALGFDLGHLRDRRGRRSVSLAALLKRVRPHALQLIEGAIATGLARADGTATATASSARRVGLGLPPAAQAIASATKCSSSPGVQGAGGASYKSGGLDSTFDFEKGAVTLGIDMKAKGIRVEVDLQTCDEKDSFKVDECPTSEGVVEGSDENGMSVAIRVTEGPKTLFAQSLKLSGETKVKAEVGNDAKLDHFDIKNTYRSVFTVGGSKQPFGPLTLDVTYQGEARVDMHSGGYTPGHTDVFVTVGAAGADAHERINSEIAIARDEQSKADQHFAAEIKRATNKLREKEAAGWMKPNACASINFEPTSDSLTLKKGDNGSLKARADAKRGGSPPSATWTVSDQQNATINPAGGEANPLSSSYNTTNAGKGIKVSANFKAVSRAGIAETPWTQNTKEEPKLPMTFTGTVTGSATYLPLPGSMSDSHVEANWNGNVALRAAVIGAEEFTALGLPIAQYVLSSGSLSYNFKGREFECDVTGSATINLADYQDVTGNFLLELYEGKPRTYKLLIPMPSEAIVEGTKSNCAHGGDGEQFAWFPGGHTEAIAYAPLPGGPVENDWSVAGAGSGTTLGSGEYQDPQTWGWNLRAGS